MSDVNKIITSNIFPAAIDFMDKNAIKTSEAFNEIGIPQNIEYLLIVQFDGDKNSLKFQEEKTKHIFNNSNNMFYEFSDNKERIEELWNARRTSYAATTRLAPDVISDDIIVPQDKIEKMLDICNDVTKKYNLNLCLVGHIGNGNLHPQIALDTTNEQEYRNYLDAKSEIYSNVVKLGGSISAEHGIGIDKLSYFENIMDKDTLNYMKMIKRIFDPNNILNPGKIFKQD